MHQLPVSEARGERRNRCNDRLQPPQNLLRGRNADIILREIDPGFEQRDQLQQLLLHWLQPPRNGSFRLLRGNPCLIQRSCINQIADRFGLRQIDAAIEVSAQGELARFGQPRAGLTQALQSIPQHHGRSMARDFDHIFGGVGARRGEISDYDLIDGAAVCVRQRRQGRGPRIPCGGSVCESQNSFDDRPRIGAGNPDDADPATAGRRGDGRDRVTGSHNGSLQDRRLKPAAAIAVPARSAWSAARAPSWTTAPVASSAKGTAAPGRVVLGTRTWRTNRLRQNFQVRRNHHHLPDGPSPTLSLRTSVSSRRDRCRMRRSRLFMGLK